MSSFRDRAVLITGAASGIGRQMALTLAAEGARIAALDLQGEALDTLAKELAGKPVATAVADVTDLPGVRAAVVEYTYAEPWTVERMSARGRERLTGYGLSVPRRRFAEPPVCPYCGSREVELDSLFGPTLCRATYLCRSCKNPFERFKPPS